MTEPPARLSEFEVAVSRVWAEYQLRGPGRLQPAQFEPVQRAFIGLANEQDALPGDLLACVRELHSLAERCVVRSEGLSFVTGEAGLVPRQDLHAAFNESLARLRSQIADRD